ncbi:hypothetical protein [Micromonospora cathayae]|uniref:Uncharacterized protein n=1 Tax=Micromonospora cathayae TaxID=3028804 RepID=A0ABY7ZPB9_9ACTN|nr:hypothetical protein [Micromonospora sp. HUAS 3]WDZ84875.1 hypothetical protein PVK37_31450 [Micromonospora sp. HUAS 3]
MAKHRRTSRRDPGTPGRGSTGPAFAEPSTGPVRPRGYVDQPGESYWSVDGCGWSAVRPGLPAHLGDLLAPPIVVGVARVPGRAVATAGR